MAAQKTTMRLNMTQINAMLNPTSAPPEPADTIYYITTETPHISDFSVFGPFHCLDATVPSIRNKLASVSPKALEVFDEQLPAWGHGGFAHIKAPLGPDGGHHMLLKLEKHKNATVRAALPGPAYTVLHCVDHIEKSSQETTICGTLLTVEAANQAARDKMEKEITGKSGVFRAEEILGDGTLSLAAGNSRYRWIVQVKYDSGEEILGTYSG
jgi:hypothetical protein